MDDAGRSFRGLMDAYRDAVHAKDVDAFVNLYARDAVVFDLWGRWAYHGRDEWRENVSAWFSSLGTERVAVRFDDVQTAEHDGVAFGHLYVTYAGVSAEGKELRAMVNRLTWVLNQTADGAWKIVHEHTSAPADLETSRVMLQRP